LNTILNVVFAAGLQQAQPKNIHNEEVVDPVENVEDEENQGEKVHCYAVHLKI
jgi:hypothetical protein